MNLTSYKRLCGRTPLVKIRRGFYAKLETYNPTGSVKDRMISYVVGKAIDAGEITKTTVLCEATSGNTGIALSAVAASLGLDCLIFMPVNMSEERKQMMRAYGAKIVDAPPDDFDGAIQMRNEFMKHEPLAWTPNQFDNPINIECHQRTTAPEIHTQVNEMRIPWTAFVHGSGTGGTIEGVRRYIQQYELITKTYMTIPAEAPHGIQGIGDGRDFLANPEDMAGTFTVKTSDAIQRARDFASETGLLVGISSGANILATEEYLDTHENNGAVVTIICDRGERYMSIY